MLRDVITRLLADEEEAAKSEGRRFDRRGWMRMQADIHGLGSKRERAALWTAQGVL